MFLEFGVLVEVEQHSIIIADLIGGVCEESGTVNITLFQFIIFIS